MLLPLGLFICPVGLIILGVTVSLLSLLPPLRGATHRSGMALAATMLVLGLVSFSIAYVLLGELVAWMNGIFADALPPEALTTAPKGDWIPWIGLAPGFITSLIVWLVGKGKGSKRGINADR
jgi:hypothetical protein